MNTQTQTYQQIYRDCTEKEKDMILHLDSVIERKGIESLREAALNVNDTIKSLHKALWGTQFSRSQTSGRNGADLSWIADTGLVKYAHIHLLLRAACLEECNLANIKFPSNSDLSCIHLAAACLENVVFGEGTDLSDADLTRARLINADLRGVKWGDEIYVEGADMTDAKLDVSCMALKQLQDLLQANIQTFSPETLGQIGRRFESIGAERQEMLDRYLNRAQAPQPEQGADVAATQGSVQAPILPLDLPAPPGAQSASQVADGHGIPVGKPGSKVSIG